MSYTFSQTLLTTFPLSIHVNKLGKLFLITHNKYWVLSSLFYDYSIKIIFLKNVLRHIAYLKV